VAANTNQRGDASGSFTSVNKNVGRDEVELEPAMMTSSARDQEVVQEEATCDAIPFGWRPGFTLLLDRGEGSDYGCRKVHTFEKIPPQPRNMQ
jgi:hypothetical protein